MVDGENKREIEKLMGFLIFLKWTIIPGGVGPIRSGSPVGETSCDGSVRAIEDVVRSGGCVARQYAYEIKRYK